MSLRRSTGWFDTSLSWLEAEVDISRDRPWAVGLSDGPDCGGAVGSDDGGCTCCLLAFLFLFLLCPSLGAVLSLDVLLSANHVANARS